MSAQFRMKLSTRTLKYPQGRNHIFPTDSTNLALCEFIPHEILAFFLYFAVKITHAYFVYIFRLPEAITSLCIYYCMCCRIWFVKMAEVWTFPVTFHRASNNVFLTTRPLASYSECYQSSYFAPCIP